MIGLTWSYNSPALPLGDNHLSLHRFFISPPSSALLGHDLDCQLAAGQHGYLPRLVDSGQEFEGQEAAEGDGEESRDVEEDGQNDEGATGEGGKTGREERQQAAGSRQ